jgi:hypothetical protein
MKREASAWSEPGTPSALGRIAAGISAPVQRSLRVEQVPTPYRLRHRRVNSLGDLADIRNHQRSFELVDRVLLTARVSANGWSGVLMSTLLSSRLPRVGRKRYGLGTYSANSR